MEGWGMEGERNHRKDRWGGEGFLQPVPSCALHARTAAQARQGVSTTYHIPVRAFQPSVRSYLLCVYYPWDLHGLRYPHRAATAAQAEPHPDCAASSGLSSTSSRPLRLRSVATSRPVGLSEAWCPLEIHGTGRKITSIPARNVAH